MLKLCAVQVVVIAAFFPSAIGAQASDVPDVGVSANDAALDINVSVASTGHRQPQVRAQNGRTGASGAVSAAQSPANRKASILVDPNGSLVGIRVDALGFELSRSVCPDGQQAFTIKRFTPNVANNATILGSATRTCETPTASAQVSAATPPITVTQTMFQSLPLKQRRTECNCGQGKEQLPYGTVTVPIVFWQDNTPETVTTTMLGQVIEVQATPIHWSMNFGDNTPPWNSKTPGVAYHDNYKIIHPDTIPGTIWHAWEHRGRYPITQTITYTGQFRVNGGPWQPIPGNATKPGPSTTVIINSYIALEVAPNY